MVLVLLTFVSLPCWLQVTAQSDPAVPAYLDPTQPRPVRVEDLLARMTLKEKIGQLNLPCVYVDQLGKTIPEKLEGVKQLAAGTFTKDIGPGAGFFTLADQIKMPDVAHQVAYFNELQRLPSLKHDLRFLFWKTKRGRMASCFPGRQCFRRDCQSEARSTYRS